MRQLIILFCLGIFLGGGLFWYTQLRNGALDSSELQIIPEGSGQADSTGSLQAAISETFQASILSDDATGLLEPIEEFIERIKKKPFGIYITPETSPVQPDRFTGYHTGVDVEYEDVSEDVPVRAIADGVIILNKFVPGYGGTLVIRHATGGKNLLALYGHLDPERLPQEGVNRVIRGQAIGVLGEGGTGETDGARKHLHLAFLKNEEIDVRGYVETQEELESWYDPLDFYLP